MPIPKSNQPHIKSTPKISFYGGVGTVTGANFLFEANGKKILVDCGLTQGVSQANELNQAPFSYDPAQIDYLFVTHAHIDHIGLIPKLVREGFRGQIYSTPETKEISEPMLSDALKVMEFESKKEAGREALYSTFDLEQSFSLWQSLKYHTKLSIADKFSVYFKDAGHILGSAMIEFSVPNASGEEIKVLFTGDLGNSPTPLLNDTESPTGANYLVMESVYGDRNHESKAERHERFCHSISKAIERGGTVLIPAFSLERTQVILYELNHMIENGQLKSVPVFLDSPLAIKLTKIYKNNAKQFKPEVQAEISGGDDIFSFPKLKFTVTGHDSREIEQTKGSKIIIAGSGMSTGGRIVSHEGRYLPDAKNLILLMGYQALGTPGRLIQEGQKKILIQDQEVPVRAEVISVMGYSSHKDSDHLLEFVDEASETLKKVFVVMGEPKASMFLSQRINDYLGIKALYPEAKVEYLLD